MKRISTPTRDPRPTKSQGVDPDMRPRRTTIELLRQFARTYQAAPAAFVAAMPGFTLS